MVTDSNVRAIEGGYSQDLDEFEAILSWFNYYVDTSAADGRNARHKDAEAIYMRLLNALYGWKLEDANEPGHVEPAVDLKDKERHIVVQVTSSCTSRKINCTLKKDRLAYYHDEGYRLKFVFIGDQRNRAKVRNENGWVISNPHDIAFDRYTDTVFTDDLTHAFSGLRPKHRAKVLQLIRDDIGRFGSSSQTQSITIDEKDLVELINLRLHRQRRDHPSFRLMRDEVISSLLPKGIEPKEGDLIPVDRRLVKPDEGKPILFRDFLCDSWSKGTQTHLLITGRGGIGKTVALLAFATERGFLPKNVPAVYIPLYDLARYSAFSRDCIDHYLEKNFSTMEAQELIRLSYEPWRKGPRVILLLDGHNEIPVDKIHGVDDGIQAWAIRAGTQLVTTSRIPGFFGAIHTQWLELQGLSEAEVKKSIRDVTSTHVAINERLLQVLETPLMLKLYVDIELYRNWMQQRRLPLADSDSAGHLVWNYLQRELFRCTEVDKGYVQNIEYAVALLLVLPYVCWRMERKHEFKISEIAFNEYVGEACNYWKDRKKPSSFVKTENALLSHFNSMDLSKLNELITTILLNEEGFFVWNRGGYSLMHQSLRDGLAAIHLNNVITLMPSKLPFEFTLSISEYVSSFLVDMAEREPLMHLWELNRNEQRTNTISTHNILRVIHGYFDGDLSELNWSGMDLSRTNLYSFRCGHALKLSPDPSHFNDTVIDVKCFIPQGHSGTINAVCFTPDGSLLASCSDDGTVRLWDVSSGRHVISLAHGLHRLNSISFNIDGSLLAVGTDNGAVVLWDISTGDKHCMPFKNEKSPIWAVCINQQGTILAAGTEQGYVELWSIAAHQPLMIMMLHNSSVKSICFSPDGSILFSGSYDGTIILWSVKKCEPIGEPLRVGGGSIWSIAISPDGAYLACGASDGKVRLWKTSKAGLHSIRIFEHGGWLRTVGFSADGSLLASGSTDGTVRIWNLAAVRQTSVIDVHSGQIRSIHFSSDGHLLASGSDAGTIKLWDVLTGRPAGMKLVRKKLSLRTACFSPTGREIAIGAEDSSIELWDTRTGRIMQTAYVRSKDVANAIVFSRIGNIAAISTSSGAVFIWDVLANQLTHISIPKSMGLPRRMVFSPDGRVLSINSNSGKISFWSVDTGVEIEARQFLDRQAFDSLCFTKDGSLITAKQCNREVELWKEPQIRAGNLSFNRRTIIAHSCLELVGEKLVEEPPGNPTHLWLIIKDGAGAPLLLECGDWNQVACTSPDGRLLAFGDEDGTVRFWNIKTLERMKSVNIARSAIKFLCFSPNSRFLAIGSADGTVRMWDVLGLRTRLIGVHHKRVRSLDYNPCRGILASGSDDGFVRIWRSQKNGKFIRTELLEGNGQPITTVRFSSSGSVLAGGSNDGRVWLWNLLTGKLIGSPFIGCMHSIVTLRISPDGNLLACGTDDGIIHMWHLASDNPTGKVVQLWHVVDAKDGDIDPAPYIRKSVLAISFSPDGTLIASGDECGSIRFRNALNGSRVDFIPRENSTGTVLALSFSPDGCILASSESDGTVHLWDIVNRIELRSLEMQNAAANTLCFSPSGRLLAMGTSDGAIKLWDFESKDGGVVSLDERKGAIWSICFNSSETTLFCAYDSNEVLAWDVGYIKTSSMPHAEIYTDVITPLLGIDLTNNDFSHARIEGESRKTLWQNGVTL